MTPQAKYDFMPVGPLMIEHRLIERMIDLLRNPKQDAAFITAAVDFFRTYADRTHHGKEEDILFCDLQKKPLSEEHKKMLSGLLEDHVRARQLVKRLESLKQDSKADIEGCCREIVALYTEHIKKEDKEFFIPVMKYFSKQEQTGMIDRMWEFDRKMIHEKYKKIVDSLCQRTGDNV